MKCQAAASNCSLLIPRGGWLSAAIGMSLQAQLIANTCRRYYITYVFACMCVCVCCWCALCCRSSPQTATLIGFDGCSGIFMFRYLFTNFYCDFKQATSYPLCLRATLPTVTIIMAWVACTVLFNTAAMYGRYIGRLSGHWQIVLHEIFNNLPISWTPQWFIDLGKYALVTGEGVGIHSNYEIIKAPKKAYYDWNLMCTIFYS